MNDNAGALFGQNRQQSAIKPDSHHQILIQRLRPFIVVEHTVAASRCAGTAKDMHDNVDAAELF